MSEGSICMPGAQKGQAGAMIVLMAVLCVVIGIFYLLDREPVSAPVVSRAYEIESGFNYSVEGAGDFVNACLNRSVTYQLIKLGRDGLGFEMPRFNVSKAPVLINGSKVVGVSVSGIQEGLTFSIQESMKNCVADLKQFSDRGFTITGERPPGVRVVVGAEQVEVYYTNAFGVIKDNKKKTFQNFKMIVPSLLPLMVDKVNQFETFAKGRPEQADLALFNDGEFETILFPSDSGAVLVMRDMEHYVAGAPYEVWVGQVEK